MKLSRESRLLFQSELANKEFISKEFENESNSKKFYFKTRFNYCLIVVTCLLFVFYGCLPEANSQSEVDFRLLLGDYTYNWGLPFRSYLWLITFDVHLVGVATGFLFLFSTDRNDWIEVLDVLNGKVEAANVGLFANAASKSRKRLLKWTHFAFSLSKWIIRFYFLAIIGHVLVLPFLMAFDYNLTVLFNELPKKLTFLVSLMPLQLYHIYVLSRLFPLFVAPFCYFYITTLIINQSTTKFNLICKTILKNHVFLESNKSDRIVAFLVDLHDKVYCRLQRYNRFWSRFYFIFNVGIIVYNLPVTYLFLLGEIDLAARVIAAYMSIVSLSIIMLMGLKTAKLSTEFHRSYPLLNSIYGGYNSRDKQVKLKVLK